MDPSLLQQHKAFKNRSLALPAVEKYAKRTSSSVNQSKSNRTPSTISTVVSTPSPSSSFHSKPQANKHKFALLAEIVKHMKSRHQKGDTHALTLDEMLEECKLEGRISSIHKNWLQNEALENNPKIQVLKEDPIGEVKYTFKPKYNIKDKKALLKLLDRHDQRGLGGIMRDDIEEGLPNANKCIKNLRNKILFVTRPDKKQVAFYNDRSCDIVIDEEFQKLWRQVAVDSVDDNKIEEYLNSHGITSMQETVKKPVQQKRKKVNRKRRFNAHNDHLGDMLKDYSTEN